MVDDPWLLPCVSRNGKGAIVKASVIRRRVFPENIRGKLFLNVF